MQFDPTVRSNVDHPSAAKVVIRVDNAYFVSDPWPASQVVRVERGTDSVGVWVDRIRVDAEGQRHAQHISASIRPTSHMTESSALETGVIYCDDNLTRMATLPSESVDLIYLDPPFFSNRVYEVIWGDEAEVRSFADRWEGGIHVYINWMRARVMEGRCSRSDRSPPQPTAS